MDDKPNVQSLTHPQLDGVQIQPEQRITRAQVLLLVLPSSRTARTAYATSTLSPPFTQAASLIVLNSTALVQKPTC